MYAGVVYVVVPDPSKFEKPVRLWSPALFRRVYDVAYLGLDMLTQDLIQWICPHCNNQFMFSSTRQKGGHLTNCNMNPKKSAILQKISAKNTKPRLPHIVICPKCGTSKTYYLTQAVLDSGNFPTFCSKKCSNARVVSNETKEKISLSLTGRKAPYNNQARIAAQVAIKEKQDAKFAKWEAEAISDFEKYKIDPLFNLGIGLYWGEGSKLKRTFEISNADPYMLVLWKQWVQKIFPDAKLRLAIAGHADVIKNDAITFWSNHIGTDVGEVKFYVSSPRTSKGIAAKFRRLPYGTAQVSTRSGSREHHFKMMKWLELYSSQKDIF